MKQEAQRQRFLPFASLGTAGFLRVEGVRLDGRTIRLGPLPPDAVIALDDFPTPRETVEVDVALGLPRELRDCLLDGEKLAAVGAIVVAEAPQTWFRAVAPLRRRSGGDLAGTVVAPARAFDDRFEIHAVLCRSTAGVPVPGRASEKGARLGSTPPVAVRVRPSAPAPGGLLDVRPAAFSTADGLQRWADQPWCLQVTADPPVLWLNEELPEVAAVLATKGTTGRRARLRDLLFRSIALQAWTALFHAAVAGIGREHGEPTFAVAWHEAALRLIAEHAYPGVPRAERLARLLEHARDAGVHPEHLGVLLEDVALGLQRHLDLATVAERAAAELRAEPP